MEVSLILLPVGVGWGHLWGFGDLPNSGSGRAARYEALERTFVRKSLKVDGRSLTTIMPREDGPKAVVRVSKDTVPASLSIYTFSF